MKIKNKIIPLLTATLGILTSCKDDITTPIYTVGDVDNAIVLKAGVADKGAGVQTRTRGVDGNHASNPPYGGGHVPFNTDVTTQLRLRVDGTWLGKGFTNNLVTKETTATIGEKTGADNKHNKIVFSDALKLYWDDYGTADPANIDLANGGTAANGTGGRQKGLTIYGVAIEGEATAPAVSSWTNLSWVLPTDQTGGWATKDLLTSNNVTASADGTYKFDDFKRTSGKTPSDIIEFTHAMSKVTVTLTAGEGFVGGKFVQNPTVTLKNFKYTGTVNIEAKTSNPSDATSDIQMHLKSGGAGQTGAEFDALVYPGNSFADETDILELTADGNTYIVNATKLNAAIQNARTNSATTHYPDTDNKFQQGWNYVVQIVVNKTGIDVLATIVDWQTINLDSETPKIRIDTAYGLEPVDPDGPEKSFKYPFDFFRSTTKASGYANDAYVDYDNTEQKYVMHDQLYWPDHQTHYFFRGVYPRVYVDSETGKIPTAKVTDSTIEVQNAAYVVGDYPSDLAIGYPRTTSETCTHGKNVANLGICATEGKIRMNFRYVMSQVEVKLTSAAGDGHVNIDANTVIKIVGGYTAGNIKLEDGSAVTTGSKADWIMLGGSYDDRLDAIVPQSLGDMKFVVIVKNAEDNYDTYECKIANIEVGGDTITKWESGKKYVYTLEIQKTGIKTNATIKNWDEVNANQDIWF